MIRFIVFFSILLAGSANAGVPEAKVEYASTYQGHATIAGTLTAQPQQPVGVTVENGGLIYSTVTDPLGNWSIVIRHMAVHYSVKTFDLHHPTDKSISVEGKLSN